MKKRIICFGDSNTWGFDAERQERFDEETRWPMVLQSLLGADYQIIEEGQNGRTIAFADPWEWGTKCGMDYVLPMVESHMPFDLLIIMLGTNDLKAKFHVPAGDIAGSLQNMLMKIKGFLPYRCPVDAKILVMAPPHIGEGIGETYFGEFLEGQKTVEKSRQLARWYRLVAEQFGCAFFDAAEVASAGDIDHMHMSAESHRRLAEALSRLIPELLEEAE